MDEKTNIKPIRIVRHEFIEAMKGLINDSHLPTFIMEPILKDFYIDVKMAAQRQLESDMKSFYQGDHKKE